jgi:16S rRNA (adenine1518-N6/adenine1519-N6)-dimethyltransferase
MLCDWLFYAQESVTSMTLMLQREVIERICAEPGGKDYGRLSILCQLLSKCYKSFDVGPESFTPAPKVVSSIVQIIPNNLMPKDEFKILQTVLQAAFCARRKMLKSSLQKLLSPQEFTILGIDATARAQNLTPQDYARVAAHLKSVS